MTVLIAVLNKQAVALAADSAVTIGDQKIFNTVNKLFALSKYHPVGIMIYSSADVMGVPVETAIKSFRKTLGTTSFPTLEEYSERFKNFLENDIYFPEESRFENCENLLLVNFDRIKKRIFRLIRKELTGWIQPKRERIKELALKTLVGEVERYEKASEITSITSKIRNSCKLKLMNCIRFIQKDFKSAFLLSEKELQIITKICMLILTREESSEWQTGFVISGYGEKELFPQLRSFEFECSYKGVNKIIVGDSINAQHMSDVGAAVLPFAQKDMVETFVKGRAEYFDVNLIDFIERYFEAKTKQFIANAKSDPKPIKALMDGLKSELQTDFLRQLDDFTQKEHVKPLYDTVASMPKEEMAVMAEALVNLTAIKRHLSPDAETVGGPTDVAIISKGGFSFLVR